MLIKTEHDGIITIKSDCGKKVLEVETKRIYSEVELDAKSTIKFHYEEV